MATEAETTIAEVGLDEIDSDHNERSQLNEENFNDLDEGIEYSSFNCLLEINKEIQIFFENL